MDKIKGGRKAMKKRARSMLAVAAALSMTITGVLPVMAAPGAGGNAKAADMDPVMQLEFEGNTNDSAKTDRQVSVKKWSGGQSVAAEENTDYAYVDGVIGDKALQLNGGAYLSLGTEGDLNPSNLTFSMWINPQEEMTGEQILVWNKDTWDSEGWYLSSQASDVLSFQLEQEEVLHMRFI